ncbi:MAG: protein-L-isoaspartate O-methyltransferase [Beijerinckiaceae bacterium]|nr:protein-L-isoaspartate O-methyltransferase [Beijerinckiaceae bacterium]
MAAMDSRGAEMDEMRNARRVMVDNQIRTFDVTDPAVLLAFETVPRDLFVTPADRRIAYSDRPLQVGTGLAARPMLPPLILARMLQSLEARPGEKALDVLGGAGYAAALLVAMGLDATLLEAEAGHLEAAGKAFAAAGTSVVLAPAMPGLTATSGVALPAGSFDCILLSGATEVEPAGLFPLLAEGGRLAVILRENGVSRAMLYVKSGGTIGRRRIFDVQAAVLPGFDRKPAFEF